MSLWVDKASSDFLRKREDQRFAASLMQKASSCAPVMFRMFAEQAAKNLEEYRAKTGVQITFSRENETVTIRHDPLPTFTVELTLRDSDVLIKTTKRQTAMSLIEDPHIELMSFAAGPNPQEYYYVYQGVKVSDPESAVAAILYPLVAFAAL